MPRPRRDAGRGRPRRRWDALAQRPSSTRGSGPARSRPPSPGLRSCATSHWRWSGARCTRGPPESGTARDPGRRPRRPPHRGAATEALVAARGDRLIVAPRPRPCSTVAAVPGCGGFRSRFGSERYAGCGAAAAQVLRAISAYLVGLSIVVPCGHRAAAVHALPGVDGGRWTGSLTRPAPAALSAVRRRRRRPRRGRRSLSGCSARPSPGWPSGRPAESRGWPSRRG